MSVVQFHAKKTGDIAVRLLSHYDEYARSLPWRMPPASGLPDPYHIWLSEIMLQQTTVVAVIPYFQKFTATWPDFESLAHAEDADVMAAWAGLGYYARARNLLKCARVVVAEFNGQLPGEEATLLQLPGIGPYTAAAISAIAFGRRAVVVDANVERVVSRLFAIGTALPSAKPLIRAATESITPKRRSGDFAQAMMDLGASVCSVRAPQCVACPLSQDCMAFRENKPEVYPVKAPKKVKPVRNGMAYWIERDGKILLIQREDKGMLAGMRALPDDRWAAQRDGDGIPPFESDWQILDDIVQHSFTHFTLLLRIAVTEGLVQPVMGEYWPLKSLDKAGMPTLFKKVAMAAMTRG